MTIPSNPIRKSRVDHYTTLQANCYLDIFKFTCKLLNLQLYDIYIENSAEVEKMIRLEDELNSARAQQKLYSINS